MPLNPTKAMIVGGCRAVAEMIVGVGCDRIDYSKK